MPPCPRAPCSALIENKDKVVVAPASSAYKHSLKEVLSAPGIAARIKVRPRLPLPVCPRAHTYSDARDVSCRVHIEPHDSGPARCSIQPQGTPHSHSFLPPLSFLLSLSFHRTPRPRAR